MERNFELTVHAYNNMSPMHQLWRVGECDVSAVSVRARESERQREKRWVGFRKVVGRLWVDAQSAKGLCALFLLLCFSSAAKEHPRHQRRS